jgi:hypothetical protein
MSHKRSLSFCRIFVACFTFLSLVTLTRDAQAACGLFDKSTANSNLIPRSSAFTPAGPVSFAPTADADDNDDSTVVGMWKFTFKAYNTAGIPDGTVVDAGYATWHSDGTEIMNSGRAPITGSFCMGVWDQDGRRSYRLNHVGLSWDPSGAVFVGPAQIREWITVSRDGLTYTGQFTIDQRDTDGNLLAHLEGQVRGQRVTIGTTF